MNTLKSKLHSKCRTQVHLQFELRMKEVDFLSSSETAFAYILHLLVFHSQMLPWDLIKLLSMSLYHYEVKEFAGSFIKEPSCEKCPDLSVAPFFCPQQ